MTKHVYEFWQDGRDKPFFLVEFEHQELAEALLSYFFWSMRIAREQGTNTPRWDYVRRCYKEGSLLLSVADVYGFDTISKICSERGSLSVAQVLNHY
jgi:hypothetical protein